MNLAPLILKFCLIQPSMSTMPASEYESRVKECKIYMDYCIGAQRGMDKLGSCMDDYNWAYAPNRECKNDMKGKCK